jgi:hypothetical protein
MLLLTKPSEYKPVFRNFLVRVADPDPDSIGSVDPDPDS